MKLTENNKQMLKHNDYNERVQAFQIGNPYAWYL